jgi:hypothetical protein
VYPPLPVAETVMSFCLSASGMESDFVAFAFTAIKTGKKRITILVLMVMILRKIKKAAFRNLPI